MDRLKYKIIKNKAQYKEYCSVLEALLESNSKSKENDDEIELLTFLIEKWDEEHNSFNDLDPVQLLTALMEEHKMKAKDIATLLDVSKGLVSDIMHYKKGISKGAIHILANYFKVAQEGFNRPYKMKSDVYTPQFKPHRLLAAEPKVIYRKR